MKKEVYQQKDIQEDPFFQQGIALGLQASPPFSSGKDIDFLIKHRIKFLAGYARGLEEYMSNKNIILPLGTAMPTSNMDVPFYLMGFMTGLKRENPNNTSSSDNFNTDGANPENPQVWANTLNIVESYMKRDGYMIGFLLSIARDYNMLLPSGGHDVPVYNERYEFFLRGKEASLKEDLLLLLKRAGGFNWLDNSRELYCLRSFATGLRIWLREQHFDPKLADEIITPQALDAFRKALLGDVLSETEKQDRRRLLGHILGSNALKKKNN